MNNKRMFNGILTRASGQPSLSKRELEAIIVHRTKVIIADEMFNFIKKKHPDRARKIEKAIEDIVTAKTINRIKSGIDIEDQLHEMSEYIDEQSDELEDVVRNQILR